MPPTRNPRCAKWALQILSILDAQLLLNEAQMPSVEEIKKLSSDDPDSDSKFEDEPTEEETQNDTSSTEMQEEMESSGSVEKLRPKPAYLSSNAKSQKQSLFAVISDSWSQSQKIRYSQVEKSNFCNIVMKWLRRESWSVPPLSLFTVLSTHLHCWDF